MHSKKLLFLILLLGSFFISNAQFNKGDRMVGVSVGAISYNSGKAVYSYPPQTTGYTTHSSNFGLSLTPNYGWFVNESTVIGATFILGYTHSEYFKEDESNGNTFEKDESNNFNIGIGSFARKYFSSSGKFYPFGQAGVNFGITSSDSKGFYFINQDKYSYDSKSSGGFFANAGLVLGFTRLLGKNAGLDFSVGYNFSYTKSDPKTTTQIDFANNGSIDQTNLDDPMALKYTNHGVLLSIGFQIFLEKQK
jgi:hypothetical protein